MKEFKTHVVLTALFGAALLSSCAKNGGPQSNGSGAVACGAVAANLSLTSDRLQDPFESVGKLILEDKAPRAQLATSQIIGVRTSAATMANTDRVLSAGAELSVTLKEPCLTQSHLGQIVQDMNPQNSDHENPVLSGVRSYTWKLETDLSTSEIKQMIEHDACVVGVSDANRTQPLDMPDGMLGDTALDPLIVTQGHLKTLGVTDEATQKELAALSKTQTTIAVIDTGIELAHEDLKNVLWRNPGEIPANGIDDDHNGYIDDVNGYNFATHNGSPQYLTSVTGYQHGTHVSGLAAAQASNGLGGSGVMGSGARIMMLNVFGDSSGASTSDIANAIRYAADNGASVINISLGGSGRSATYESAITYALRKGVAIFAAAGNEHAELGPDYWMSPGSYGQQFDGMMSVGSIDSANGALSAYSNFSSTFVEILAPGSEDSRGRLGLLSTWPGNKYARIQGTSMSSPVAAGAAAIAFSLMRERGYDPSAATIEYVMAAASIHTPELYGYAAGGRVLNVKSLVEFIIATYPRVTGNHIDPGVPGFKACGH